MTNRICTGLLLVVLPLALTARTSAQAPDQFARRSDRLAEVQGPEAALEYLKTELDRAIRSGDVRNQALVTLALGRRALQADQHDEASAYFESSRKLAEAVHDPLIEGMTLGFLGRTLREMGQLEASRDRYERAVETLKSGTMPNQAIQVIRNLASSETHLIEKELLLEKAEDLASRLGALNAQAAILEQWSNALIAAGDLAGALEKLKRVMGAVGSQTDWPGYPKLLTSLGNLYRSHGNYQKAIECFERVLELHRQSGDQVGESAMLQFIGASYLQIGDRRKGLEYMEKAVVVAREGAAPKEPFAKRLAALGVAYVEVGEYTRAIRLLDEAQGGDLMSPPLVAFWALSSAYVHTGRYVAAIEVANRGIDLTRDRDNVRVRLMLLYWRSQALHKLGRTDDAIAGARESLELIEQIRARLVPDDFMKRGFTTQYLRSVNLAIELFFETGRHGEGFEVAEQARSRSFLDLLATRNAAAIDDVILEDETELPRSLGTASDEPALPSTISTPPATAAHVGRLAERQNSTVLAYWTNADALYIWLLRADGSVAGARQKVQESRLNEVIRKAESKTAMDREAWKDLYAYLISPIRSRLPKPESRLTIIPHGPLFNVSFAALVDARGRYLVEDYVLHYAPAVAALELIERHKTAAGKTPDRYLLAADPTKPPRLPSGAVLPPLTGSRLEVQKIRMALPSGAADVLAGVNLRAGPVRQSLRDHAVIHFATHAVIDSKSPLDSFLALSQGERLTVRDIYGTSINAELVMLSACRSASGPITAEGVLGLTRAFLYAGAASVIASPWDVPDELTSLLVGEFYREYRRTGQKDRALRAAQLHLLNALRSGGLQAATRAGPITLPEHPSLWAGFVLIGNP